MLGCQDFCGYYEWTFHYFRRRWGSEAIRRYWAQAIGGESQQHYAKAAVQSGLRGMNEQDAKTGEEEHSDWICTLDEAKNFLRSDMRECPSKGFLIKNNLNADEDYCDHCQGWLLPLMASLGFEVVEHEHNHCGQCWTVCRHKDRPTELSAVECDIRRNARWKHGYLHRWENERRLPLLPSVCDSSDPSDVLTAWFAETDWLAVAGDYSEICELSDAGCQRVPVVTTSGIYADGKRCCVEPLGVLLGDAEELAGVAARFHATAPDRRPLLMHPFLPRMPMIDCVSHGLPRPIPILPLLIRQGLYTHQPDGPNPDPMELSLLLAVALQKRISPAAVDIRLHPRVGRLLKEQGTR